MLKIVGNWSDDLIWCPSQLILQLEIDDEPYEIYCRWRHSDPWTISLIKQTGNKIRHQFKNIDELTQNTPIEEVHHKALSLVEDFVRQNKHKEMK